MSNLVELTFSSPLRNGDNLPKDLRVIRETAEKLAPLFIEMGRLESVGDRPLNVAVFGEVKAGKSTLVNALVGSRIAPTDVTESTAAITVFRHAPNPYGAIFFHDGSEKRSTIDDISSILDQRQKNRDQSFFATIKHVEFGIDYKDLEYIRLIDTPGLASVTPENHARAMDYSRDCDCVLWIFPGDELGNEQSRNALLQQAKEGKGKIAAIVNVYGMEAIENESRREDIERFVARHVGRPHLKGGIFIIDCKAAQDGRIAHDEALVGKSGLQALLEWLRSSVFDVAEEVKKESSREKELSLASRILVHHLDFAQDLKFLTTQMDIQSREVESNRARIEEVVIIRLRHKVGSILRIDEWRHRMEFINNNPKQKMLKDVYEEIKAHFTKDNMEKLVQDAMRSVDEKLQKEWNLVFENLKKLLIDNLDQYRMEKTSFLEGQLKTIDKTLGTFETGALAGLTGGALVLFGVGGWLAWVGPYAAYITIGQGLAAAALGPVLFAIPLAAIPGALIGRHLIQKKVREAAEQITAELDNAESRFQQVLKGEIEPALKKANAECASSVLAAFEKELIGEIGRTGAQLLQDRVAAYTADLKDAIAKTQE